MVPGFISPDVNKRVMLYQQEKEPSMVPGFISPDVVIFSGPLLLTLSFNGAGLHQPGCFGRDSFVRARQGPSMVPGFISPDVITRSPYLGRGMSLQWCRASSARMLS